jgi:hypothetical protein
LAIKQPCIAQQRYTVPMGRTYLYQHDEHQAAKTAAAVASATVLAKDETIAGLRREIEGLHRELALKDTIIAARE